MLSIDKLFGARGTLAGFGLGLGLALLVFIMNYLVAGPMIQGDEGGYLANAASIAGFYNDMASSYHAGYSILISPAFWVADNPRSIWIAVKTINAVLFFIIVITLWSLSKNLSQKTTISSRLASTTLVSLYPMWFVMAGYAFSQIAFVPVFLLTFAVFLRALAGKLRWWLALGALSGFLYWIHPTGIVPVIAVNAGGLYFALNYRRYSAFLMLLLTTMIMVICYRQGFTPWLYDRMTISGLQPESHYPGLSKLLMPFLTADGIKEILVRTGGHLFYLTIGTVGLIWVGLFSLLNKAFRTDSVRSDYAIHQWRAIAIFLCLSLIGSLALSVLLFSSNPETKRLDHWMYGRYVEGVIAPILLIGALSNSLHKGGWAIPIAVFCAVLMAYGISDYTPTVRANISAFWQDPLLYKFGIWLWLLSGVVLIAVAVILPRNYGFIVIAIVYVLSLYIHVDYHSKASRYHIKKWDAALAVRNKTTRGGVVAFDMTDIDSHSKYVFFNEFGFILYDYNFQRMNVEKWFKSCEGPIFSYQDLVELGFDAYPIARSPLGGPTAWMKGPAPSEMVAYPMTVSSKSPALLLALGPGWHELEDNHVWSTDEAKLRLPVPNDCGENECSAVLILSTFGASTARPVKILFLGETQEMISPDPVFLSDNEWHSVSVPLSTGKTSQVLIIQVPNAISPSNLLGSLDPRVLGVALRAIELRRM